MTTPGQGAPDGSVVVGGGEFNYGQLVDENTASAAFLVEPPTDLAGALKLLPVILAQLPNGSMRPWQKWLGMSDQQLANGEVQDSLYGSLNTNPFRTLMDNITNAFNGGTNMELTTNDDVFAALNKTFRTLANHAKALLMLGVQSDGTIGRSEVYTVDFAAFNTLEEAGFDVTYSGAGSSTVEIKDDVAQWIIKDSLPRDAMLVYKQQTATEFQSVRGTLSTPPQPPNRGGTPMFYALARVSSDRKSYVWARAYSNVFGLYNADMGCTVDGLDTVWASGIPLTWNLNLRFVAGVGTEPREYQLWSGANVVWSYAEDTAVSKLCDAGHPQDSDHTDTCVKFRGWGAIAQVRDKRDAARVAAAGVVDSAPHSVVGSTARMARVSEALAGFDGGGVLSTFPPSFFDEVSFESKDVDANTLLGSFSLKRASTYVVSARVELAVPVASACHLLLQGSYDGGTNWETLQYGYSVNSSSREPLSGSWIQPMPAGGALRLAYKQDGLSLSALTGGSAGAKTYFSVVGF